MVLGALGSNVWSVAGEDERADVNFFLAQYFINYNYPSGWYLTSAPIVTANWEADSGNQWTVPSVAVSARCSRSVANP